MYCVFQRLKFAVELIYMSLGSNYSNFQLHMNIVGEIYRHVEFCLSKNIHIIDHEQKSISSRSCKKATFTQGLEDSTSF